MATPIQFVANEPDGVATDDRADIARVPHEGGNGLLGFDLGAIIAAFRRNLLAVLVIIGAALALGAIATVLMVPQYQATSRLLVDQQAAEILEDGASPAVPYQDADRFLQTQVDILRSRTLAARVVESQDLAESEPFFQAQGATMPTSEDVDVPGADGNVLKALRRDVAIDLLSDATNVALPLDSRVVSVSVESADPVLAARLANAYARGFIESNLARKFDGSSYAREFLAQQLAEAREQVEQSERDLNQYSRAAGLIRVSGQGQNADQETTLSITTDSLVQLNAAASQAAAQRLEAENRWRVAQNTNAMNLPSVLQNLAVQNLLRQRSDAVAALADERERHLDQHPNVLALEAQVSNINDQIDSVASSIKRSIRVEYESAVQREQDLRDRVENLRSNALDEQDRGVQYNLLKRTAETDRALYDTLLTEFNELNATAGSTSNNVSLVDEAEPPREPVSPNVILNMVAALAAGLAFAGGFVFLREQFDDVVRTPDDVEAKLGLSVLGLIPRVDDENLQEELQDPKSPISEAYQSLVTNLRYSSGNGIPRVLTVTSSQASEGKTTTSHEMAQQFAALGKKTLLIDADLRRPTLHKRRKIGTPDGLTTLLAGEKQIEDVLVPSDIGNLSYMSALPIPPDPAALLATGRIETILEDLRAQFDTIVIDAPPLLGLSDAPQLAASGEATLLVIDGSAGRRGAVKAALRRLEMVNANIIGGVLTKFDSRSVSSAYSYYGSDYYAYESSDR